MKLVDFLDDHAILCHLAGRTYGSIVSELLAALDRGGYLRDRKAVAAAIQEREKLGSTATGKGVALPHARTDAVDGIVVAMGTSEAGIDCSAPDGEPVRIIFLLLAPLGESALYINLLGAVAQLLNDDGIRKQIFEASSSKRILKTIERSGLEVGKSLRTRDIMKPADVVVREDTSLKDVVDLMFKNNLLEIPVVDVQGVLIGELFIEDLFRMGLPDYLFRMGDVSFLTNFEPFSELLREESKKSVGDVMSAPTGQIEPDTHAIQAALLLVKRDIRSLIVIEGGKPVGIVSLFDFIEKVLRA